MLSGISQAFEIMPMTFQLPHEYTHFVTAYMAAESACALNEIQNIWILKPVGLSRGRFESLIKWIKHEIDVCDLHDNSAFLPFY